MSALTPLLEVERTFVGRAENAAFDVVDGARSRQTKCHRVIVIDESHEGTVHMQMTTIGLDIAKNVFQVHGRPRRS